MLRFEFLSKIHISLSKHNKELECSGQCKILKKSWNLKLQSKIEFYQKIVYQVL